MANQGKETRTLGPLRRKGSASTLRLQLLMEVQQRHEVGERIKRLRNASPQTNRSIADYVGVGERAVANWVAGEGIAWENAKKVAELFEVDVQWLWSGREKGGTPDPLGTPQLDRIEWKLNRVLVSMGLDPEVPLPAGADPGRVSDDEPLQGDVPEPLLPSERVRPETSEEERPAAAGRGDVRSRQAR